MTFRLTSHGVDKIIGPTFHSFIASFKIREMGSGNIFNQGIERSSPLKGREVLANIFCICWVAGWGLVPFLPSSSIVLALFNEYILLQIYIKKKRQMGL